MDVLRKKVIHFVTVTFNCDGDVSSRVLPQDKVRNRSFSVNARSAFWCQVIIWSTILLEFLTFTEHREVLNYNLVGMKLNQRPI